MTIERTNFVAQRGNFAKDIADSSSILVEQRQRLSWANGVTLRLLSPAKINLVLSVGAKRPDGYHIFESLMATVTLYDELLIKQSADKIRLVCDDSSIPTDSGNLVYRSASLMAGFAGIDPTIDIELVKKIPTRAGLGGGSSNASATLFGLNNMWDLNWPESKLLELAEMLGSDVGFFLKGPLAICSGRGEIVHPLHFTWDFWGLIIKPEASLSTSEVYQYHRVSGSNRMDASRELAERLPSSKPSQIYEYLSNDLESSAFRTNPELGVLRKELEKSLNIPVRLSGSGSAMFALFDTKEDSVSAFRKLKRFYPDLTYWVVRNSLW